MTKSCPIYSYRDPHFSPAGDTLMTVAPLELVDLAYGAGEESRQAAVEAIFGGAAVFENEATGAFYVGIWGKRNASRFRSALRQHANLEIIETAPPARLMYFGTSGPRTKRRPSEQN